MIRAARGGPAATLAPGMDGAADERRGEDPWSTRAYGELLRVARSLVAGGARRGTLGATALVHEAWLRLSASRSADELDRPRFVSLAVGTMRRILVDRARARAAAKRAAPPHRTTLSRAVAGGDPDDDLLALDAALEELRALDPELARLVELRFFGGATTEELAELLGTSPRGVKRRWRFARAWLTRRLSEEPS